MYISVDQPIRSIRSTGDGYTIVGGEAHPSGQDLDTEERYRALGSWSGDRFGAGDIDYRWSAQDYRSVDGLPYVGPLGSSGRVFMATGFAKWGMANGTIAAAIMVDLAMGRDNPLASVFDSKRAAVKQAAPGLLKAGAGVAKQPPHGSSAPVGLARSGAAGPGLRERSCRSMGTRPLRSATKRARFTPSRRSVLTSAVRWRSTMRSGPGIARVTGRVSTSRARSSTVQRFETWPRSKRRRPTDPHPADPAAISSPCG